MDNAVGVLVLGVVVGLQYGLLGVGIVLVYKAGRYVNIAHGQMGVVAAALLARLAGEQGVNYWLALALALLLVAAVAAVIERTVIQRLFNASRLALLLATIGVTQLLLVLVLKGPLVVDAIAVRRHGGYPVPFHFTWKIGALILNSSQVMTLVFGPAIAVALYLFFARTALGREVRAASSNPEAARLAGISVRRISLWVWVAAGLLSGLTAILIAPSQPTSDIAALGPPLLLRALAAALAGGMTNLGVTFAAGVGIGVAEQTALWNVHLESGGVADLTVLAIVLVAMLLRGRSLARTSRRGDDLLAVERSRPPLTTRLQGVHVAKHLGRYGWAALALFGLVLPRLPGLTTQSKAILLTFIVCYAIVGLSLTLLTGWAGQASLGHFALLGVGAYAAAQAADQHHWAVPAVLLVAGLAAALAAVAVGLPALRFRGLFLAVSTLAFAVAAQSWLFRTSWLSQGRTGNAVLLHPRLPLVGEIETPRAVYYLALAVLALVVLGLRALRTSGAGRALVAVRDNEPGAAAHGITPASAKVVAFALSGFLAGTAGALWAMAQRSWSFQAFEPSLSFTMLAIAIAGGLGTLEGPILAALVTFAWPYLLPDQNTIVARTLSSGVLLMAVLLFLPGGISSLVARGRAAILRWLERGLPDQPFGPTPGAAPLVIEGVDLAFGGLRVLDGVGMRVDEGEIVGLMGGNGAGKTTLLNCVSGHLRPDAGAIELFGREATTLPADVRAFLDVARSFQDGYLYPGLTVLETVMVALDRDDHSGVIGAVIGAPWMRFAERRKRAEAMQVLGRVALQDRADTVVGELSTGTRRLCEMATVFAARPRLVLLDEPTAGIAQREVEAFAPLLRALRDELGCAVLLVEHDVPLLLSLCDRLYVMESGRVIAEGPPDTVRDDPVVVASFLGADATAIERSGPTGRRRRRAPRPQA